MISASESRQSRLSRLITRFVGVSAVLIGVLVLIRGPYIGSLLLRVFPLNGPMLPGAELGFVLLGATLAAIAAVVLGLIMRNQALLRMKKAGDALRQSEERHRGLFDSAFDAVVVIDGETLRYEDANRAALKLYGYTKEEFLRLRVPDISAEPDGSRTMIERTLSDGSVGIIPAIRHKRKDGHVFPVEIATSVCVVDGRKKAVGMIRDLTERIEIEAELKRSEKRYRSLFESSRDALMTSEFPSSTYSSANAAALAMFRAPSLADFLSRRLGELSPEFQPDGRPSVDAAREHMEAALFEGSRHAEWTYKRFDGEEFPADVLLTRTESDGRIFIQLTVRDLTEVNRAREERRLLSTAIEQASECVVITDEGARILYVNPAFEKVTGYTRAEALGKNTSLLKSGRHDKAFYEELWGTLKSGRTWRGRLTNRRKDATLYEEDASITPVHGIDGIVTNYIAVKRDVSKERDLENKFLHAQKMEAVGRLAGGVAHDFNNLLSAISGYSYFLLNSMEPENPQRDDVEQIVKAGDRAAALTRQLLAFSRQQVLQPRVLNTNALVVDLEKMLRRLIGEDIILKLELSDSTGSISADPGQIEQVVMNLVVNARDAMPKGGTITIGTGNAELGASDAYGRSDVHPGSYVLLEIGDDGCGMDPKTMARIFEPFFTTKEQGRGTGLGLSTVYGIVKQSGGCVLVDSALGKGTRFKIYLPRAAETARGQSEPPAAASPSSGNETILLVEDDEIVRLLVRRVLKENGYVLLEASDPAEALRLCADEGRSIALLLTDIVMPVMRGDDMANIIAAKRPDMKIIFMTGYTEAGTLRANVGGAGAAFIQKPIEPASLLRLVRETLNGARADRA